MRARSWFAIALLLAAIVAGLYAAWSAAKSAKPRSPEPSPLRVPNDEELSLWGRHDSREFGQLALGEWTRACRHFSDDIRAERVTIDEAFVFAYGALQGIEWNSATKATSGTGTSYTLRAIRGEEVGRVTLAPAALLRPARVVVELNRRAGSSDAPERGPALRLEIELRRPTADETSRVPVDDSADEVAEVLFLESIEATDPQLGALKPGGCVCIGGRFIWNLDGPLRAWTTMARGLQFENRDEESSAAPPSSVATDCLQRIQMLLDRH